MLIKAEHKNIYILYISITHDKVHFTLTCGKSSHLQLIIHYKESFLNL